MAVVRVKIYDFGVERGYLMTILVLLAEMKQKLQANVVLITNNVIVIVSKDDIGSLV